MRTQNTIFFVCGLVFGVLVGYFVFQSLSSGAGRAPSVATGPPSTEPVTERRVLDPQQVAALERVAAEKPDDAEVRFQIGTLYLDAGRYEEAVRWLRQAVGKKGGDLHLRNHLALALSGMGRIDEAVSEYETALAIEPSHPQSLLGLGRLLLYGRNDIRGLEVWEKLVEVAPESPEARSIREELETLKMAHSGR